MSDAVPLASTPSSAGTYAGSSSSGFYVSRPSIALNVEKTMASVVSAAGHVVVKLDVLSDHQVYSAADGGLGGVFVVSALPSKPGSSLTLDLLLPWGETLEVLGEVEWVLDVPRASLRHRPGMGVKADLNEQQTALLERAMLLRSPMTIPPDVRRA